MDVSGGPVSTAVVVLVGRWVLTCCRGRLESRVHADLHRCKARDIASHHRYWTPKVFQNILIFLSQDIGWSAMINTCES